MQWTTAARSDHRTDRIGVPRRPNRQRFLQESKRALLPLQQQGGDGCTASRVRVLVCCRACLVRAAVALCASLAPGDTLHVEQLEGACLVTTRLQQRRQGRPTRMRPSPQPATAAATPSRPSTTTAARGTLILLGRRERVAICGLSLPGLPAPLERRSERVKHAASQQCQARHTQQPITDTSCAAQRTDGRRVVAGSHERQSSVE